jgi:hypothetical protein
MQEPWQPSINYSQKVHSIMALQLLKLFFGLKITFFDKIFVFVGAILIAIKQSFFDKIDIIFLAVYKNLKWFLYTFLIHPSSTQNIN